ncbi:MAG: hypothetical protein EPO11_02050 [Gammaproteobacteria bacterium]|nr:MAG: hypothetical protein EPO11_02050 [Gammaproteobacteria bacterium]
MLKKILIIGLIFFGTVSRALAGFYMGPLVAYESIKSHSVSYLDINPRLSLGYGDVIRDSAYLAGEIFLGPKSFTVKNGANDDGSLTTSYSYGFSLLPGFCLDEVILAYARLGIIATHFDNSNVDLTRRGYQAGAGLQGDLSASWSIRGEYTHTSYVEVDGLGKPRADQYAVGLVYHLS